MSNKRLLIIEDDYDVAEMLLMYFTSNNFEVFHADNGVAGLELARRKFPNLILLDVMMPEMDGYEVCLNMRQQALTRHIPVIFLTQKDGRADKVEGLQLGADDYIAKPFDVDELRLRVTRSIERATRESLHERRTGLPTGPLIEEELARASNTTQHAELRIQISGFSTFADVYGFMAADQVMAFAARTIREAISENGTQNDFLGIEDNDFILITYAKDADGLLSTVTSEFNEGARAFYTFVDVERGGVLVNEGQTNEELIPIMQMEHAPATSNA
jgi:DNA-binding response OmpR family regulator